MKFADVLFLDVSDVVDMHDQALIYFGGGMPGIRDTGLLASAVMAPRNGYILSLAEIAATYCFGLAMNHPFIDGNKRTAITAAGAFLSLHGYRLGTLNTDEWERHVLDVAAGALSRDDVAVLFAKEMARVANASAPVWAPVDPP